MVEIITATKRVKARKDHICSWCGCDIYTGETYITSVLKYDGTIYAWKNHIKCGELVSKLNMEGDEGVTGDDFYEYITEEYDQIWREDDNDYYESKDYRKPSFKEQVEFVYKKRCDGN